MGCTASALFAFAQLTSLMAETGTRYNGDQSVRNRISTDFIFPPRNAILKKKKKKEEQVVHRTSRNACFSIRYKLFRYSKFNHTVYSMPVYTYALYTIVKRDAFHISAAVPI